MFPKAMPWPRAGRTCCSNDANDSNVPATITAKQKAEYFLKSNEVVFEGDVQGKMVGSVKRIQ